jgi:hypothetical protein
MAWQFANCFSEILPTCKESEELGLAMIALIFERPTSSKALEGGGRAKKFNVIIERLILGELNLDEAIRVTGVQLSPEKGSTHLGNRRVFSAKWERRLVETILSRRYCEVVLKQLNDAGQEYCIVPNLSPKEQTCDQCAQLVGKDLPVNVLYEKLVRVDNQEKSGDRYNPPLVPAHPYCKHVVRPKFK